MDFDFKLWLGLTLVLSVLAYIFIKHYEKLEADAIVSGDLIVIKANPRKAWPSLLKWVLPLAPLLIFTMWSKRKPLECSHFLDVNLAYIQLVIYIFVLPIIMTLLSYYAWQIAKKSLKDGFFPPANHFYLTDTKVLSISLKRVKRKIYFTLYFLPFFTLFFYGISVFFYQKLHVDKGYTFVESNFEKKCLFIKHYP
jgi:hypothetical protein